MGELRPSAQGPGGRDEFTATHWTQVAMAARVDDSEEALAALEALCTRYWPAIYAFLRRRGRAAPDAEDLTQGFFAEFVDGQGVARADRSKGRFRSFLLGALQRYLVDESRRQGARKRGRDRMVAAMDFPAAEAEYLEEADVALTPDQAFDHRWAGAILESAYAELEAEFRANGETARFERLRRFLGEEAADGDYEREATHLGIAPKAVSSAVCRLRSRYRDLVRRQVMATVAGPEEVDREFRELFR